MRSFLDEDFLLETATAQRLYHDHAARMPVVDYHCHLSPHLIADDHCFENLTKAWIDGDHYKWRAMRANGVPERYCTGDAPDREKFERWAETVPYTMMNPLYHWTHLELRRYFGIDTLLNPQTAEILYDACTVQLQTPAFSTRSLLRMMNVKVVCTTDDPADDLDPHRRLRDEGFEIKVLPAFRADKASALGDAAAYNAYLDRLGAAADLDIRNPDDLLEALRRRHDYFATMGCRLSDHGEERLYVTEYTRAGLRATFAKVRGGGVPAFDEVCRFKSWLLYELALMDHEKGWVQQFHLGALRSNNTRMLRTIGPDTGFDSIGDFVMARPLSHFLDRLDRDDRLAKTILYNLNPRDNELFAAMTGNFNTGAVPGKMQYGSGWWFLDQKDGMEKHMMALANMGLLSRFIGMLTDSRSFLSYPRHEYFRRILCNMIGGQVERGELPAEIDWLGQVVENISYYNARAYLEL